MSLTTGVRLGPYEVVARVGAGGMGEVYRATDTDLGRDVAIKVLPEAFARNADRLARFDREARTLASLSHPNIAAVYGLQEGPSEGGQHTRALVMEFVEGPTLADRIARGAIPPADAVPIARQIADALEAAHEQGIVHRDLKPANIKVRPDATVKVLDFGLAKALDPDRSSASPGLVSQSPTITTPAMTEAGVILGTAAYMSPEQARGKPVDRRADIWAFGCVLYEMLTGRRAFDGEHVTDVLASVVTRDVDWTKIPPDVPPAVRYVMSRCLDKDPRRRLRDIGEARVALEGSTDGQVPQGGAGARERVGRRAWAAIAAALVLGALAGALVVWRARDAGVPPLVTRTAIVLPGGQQFSYPGRQYVAIARSGAVVAYTAEPGVWLRFLGEPEARLLQGTQGDARSPFFSPDGAWVGYYSNGALWRAALTGGAPTRLVDAVNPWGASWEGGAILYGQGADGIWRIPETGGEPAHVIAARDGETLYGPHLLPGGEWVIFTSLPAGVGLWDQARIVMESVSTGERVILINGGRDVRYLPTGHLVYVLNQTVLAAAFDPGARRVATPAVPLVPGVADAGTITGAAEFDVAGDGTLVYVPAVAAERLGLSWVDRDGVAEAIPADARPYRQPRVSSDGTQIAVEVQDVNDTNVWVGTIRGAFTPLTREAGEDSFPQWSPDGQRVVFFSARNGGGLFVRSADGTGTDVRLVEGADWRPAAWTSDDRLIYEQFSQAQIVVRAPQADSTPQLFTLLDDPAYFDILHPALSPDGRWVAYHSTESGPLEIYVRPFPDIESNKWRISTGGGYSPVWSRDGRELYYLAGGRASSARPPRQPDGSLMAVGIETRPAFAAGAPVRLFGLRDFVFPSPMGRHYDVAPDGRFLMLRDTTVAETRVGPQIVVVQRWFEELNRLVPVR